MGMSPFVVAVLLCQAPAGQTGVTSARDTSQTTLPAVRLSGRVISTESGRPLRRAQVRLTGQPRVDRVVTTDRDGRWTFADVTPGRYNLVASKDGFVRTAFGQRHPSEAGKPIEVSADSSRENLVIALPRAGAITGRVTDELGEAFTGARVSALKYTVANGSKRLIAVGVVAVTDDLGAYRLYNLPPGDYYVRASIVATPFDRSEDATGYEGAFAPNTPLVSSATRVSLVVGQEVPGIDIAVAPTRVATVSGIVLSPQGDPSTDVVVTLASASLFGDGGLVMSSPVMVKGDGTFTIDRVLPGEYRLETRSIADLDAIAGTGSSDSMSHSTFASLPLSVNGEDVRNLTLVLRETGTARGRIVVDGDGGHITDLSSVRLTAVPTGPAPTFPPSVRLRTDGTFEIRGLVGRRLLRATGPAGWRLKSVTVDGNDVTDTGLDFDAVRQVADIEVTLVPAVHTLAGTVQSAVSGNPILDYVIVAFASDSTKWGNGTRFVRTARPDQNGAFDMDGLPSGEYLVAVLDSFEAGQESDPDVLERLRPLGTPMSIDEDRALQVTLKVNW